VDESLSALLRLASLVDGRVRGWHSRHAGADRPLSDIWVGVLLFAARPPRGGRRDDVGHVRARKFSLSHHRLRPAPRQRLRQTAAVRGILFHLTIAVVMGLVAFDIVITATLLVSLQRRRVTEPAPRHQPEASIPDGKTR